VRQDSVSEGEGEESKSGGESKSAAKATGGSASGKRALAPFTMTEEEEEADWNTARDEAEEAAALKAALSGQKPAKKRRIQKVADIEDAAHKPASYRSLLAGRCTHIDTTAGWNRSLCARRGGLRSARFQPREPAMRSPCALAANTEPSARR